MSGVLATAWLAFAPAQAGLRVLWRQIDPPRVHFLQLSADGDLTELTLVPPSQRLLHVRRGRYAAAGAQLDALAEAGFFEWPESSLVPPADEDADSDPYRIELRTAGRTRLLVTRDPHIPTVLAGLLQRLQAHRSQLAPAPAGTVLVPRTSRRPTAGVPELRPAAWPPGLQDACAGLFPLVLEREDPAPPAPPATFLVRLPDQVYEIHLLDWDPPMSSPGNEKENHE